MSLILLSLTVLLLGAGRLVDGRWVTPPGVFASSLILPPLILDIPVDVLTGMALAAAAACFGFGYAVVRSTTRDAAGAELELSDREATWLRRVVLVCFGLAQVAFLANAGRTFAAFGPLAYFVHSPKEIEQVFGRYTALNYLFFLNIVAAAFSAYLLAARRGGWLLRLVVIVATGELIFTGIKSAFVFAAVIVAFVGILARPERIAGLLGRGVLLAGLGLMAFAVVNLGVFGSERSLPDLTGDLWRTVQTYIVPNYENLRLELHARPSYTYGRYTFFFVTKLLHPEVTGYFDTGEFLLVDQDNNMGTLLREYFVDFGALGVVGLPMLLGCITGTAVRWWRSSRRPGACVTVAVLTTACAFAFFGNQFVRLQFFFIIAVAALSDAFIRRVSLAPGQLRPQGESS